MFHPLPQSLPLIQLSFSNGSIIKNDCSELEAELWLQFNNATDDLKPNVTIKIENIQSHYCLPMTCPANTWFRGKLTNIKWLEYNKGNSGNRW